MANTSSKLSFAISYGLAGGPLHARKFNQLLSQTGLRPAEQLNRADIIIAHSGGCSLIPKTARPRLVIYVGMVLAQSKPSQTWLAAKVMMAKHSRRAGAASTMAKNAYYSLVQPRRNIRMIHNAKASKPVIFPGCPAVFIANRHDPWPQDKQLQGYLDRYDWAFIGMPGAHDDIWEHPDRYVALINHYARLLA